MNIEELEKRLAELGAEIEVLKAARWLAMRKV